MTEEKDEGAGFTIEIPNGLYERVKKIAKAEGRKPEDVIYEAVMETARRYVLGRLDKPL